MRKNSVFTTLKKINLTHSSVLQEPQLKKKTYPAKNLGIDHPRRNRMSKSKDAKKEEKKKPQKTLKEKRLEKQEKKKK